MKHWDRNKLREKLPTGCLCCWSHRKWCYLRKPRSLLAKEPQLSEKDVLKVLFPRKRPKHTFLISKHVHVTIRRFNDKMKAKIISFIPGYFSNFSYKETYLITYVYDLFIYMYLWIYANVYKCLWRKEEGVKSHAAGGSGGCGYWEPISGHLQDQQKHVIWA